MQPSRKKCESVELVKPVSDLNSHQLGRKSRIDLTFESSLSIFHLLVLICSFSLELKPPLRNQRSSFHISPLDSLHKSFPNDFRTHSKDANIIYLIMCIMPDNLEEFHDEQKQVRTTNERKRKLFMRLIEINDDL